MQPGYMLQSNLTVLPPREALERKLADAIGAARLRFESKPEASAS
jgi:hypothetical protein